MTPLQKLAYDGILQIAKEADIMELPSERVLAERIGISRPVIQHALKILTKDGLIPPLRGKKRFFRFGAKHSSGDGPNTVGLISTTGGFMWPERDRILRMLREHLIGAGYNIMSLELRSNQLHRIDRVTRSIPSLCGVIVATVWEDPVYKWLEQFCCPVVVLDHISRSRRFVDVLPDEKMGSRKIVQLFHQAGVRDVVYLDYLDDDWNSERWNSFSFQADRFKIKILNRYFLSSESSKDQCLLKKVLARTPGGSGIFCANSFIATALLVAMYAGKLKTPEDFKVAAASEEDICFGENGKITRCCPDWKTACEVACKTLCEMIKRPSGRRQRLRFPMQLFRQESL